MSNSLIKMTLTLLLTIGSISSAWSYSFSTTLGSPPIQVGGLDTYISFGSQAGSPTSEEAWVNSQISPLSTSFSIKTETVNYYAVNGETDIFAFALQSTPDYFILKNATYIALFQNNADFGWGVFQLSSYLAGIMNITGSGSMTISHVTEFKSPTTSIPEPGSLALICLGLLGLTIARKVKLT